MIAIPNMEKPKSCDECVKSLDIECCGDIRNCPLIEIVTCGECICYRGDHNYCYNDYFARENGFCSYGERRTETLDERIKRGLKEWREK